MAEGQDRLGRGPPHAESNSPAPLHAPEILPEPRAADARVGNQAALHARIAELEADRLLLNEQVRQLHRVKAITELLTGVAHDLGTALTAIIWCSEALARRLGAHDAELRSGIADIVGATSYARKLAQRLIALAHEPSPHFAPCLAADVVAQSIALLETLRPRSVKLCTAVRLEGGRLWGDADQLQQVLINLVSNSFAATAATGGTTHVELERVPSPLDEHDRAWLCFRVRDTGHGMNDETLRRAFEPFFTTKPAHEGNGLGLVIVRNIAQRHQGLVRARSAEGHGTTIEVLLPEFVC